MKSRRSLRYSENPHGAALENSLSQRIIKMSCNPFETTSQGQRAPRLKTRRPLGHLFPHKPQQENHQQARGTTYNDVLTLPVRLYRVNQASYRLRRVKQISCARPVNTLSSSYTQHQHEIKLSCVLPQIRYICPLSTHFATADGAGIPAIATVRLGRSRRR